MNKEPQEEEKKCECDNSKHCEECQIMCTKIKDLYCGNDCNEVEPYGFVPESGCKIHDLKIENQQSFVSPQSTEGWEDLIDKEKDWLNMLLEKAFGAPFDKMAVRHCMFRLYQKNKKDIAEAKREEEMKFRKILNSGKAMYEMGRKEERERVKKIVMEETPKHVTREYRDTDSMRDRITSKLTNTEV